MRYRRPEIYEAVVSNPQLLKELANLLLEGHFPATLHPDICDAVGLGELVPSQEAGGDEELAIAGPLHDAIEDADDVPEVTRRQEGIPLGLICVT